MIGLEDAVELSSYFLHNVNHLCLWESSRFGDYHSLTAWETRASAFAYESAQGQAYRYAVRLKNENTIVGVVNFTNVVCGVFKPVILVFLLMKNNKAKASCLRIYRL